MQELDQKSLDKLDQRILNDSLRQLGESNNLTDFSSNDYLGFSKNKKIYNNTLAFLDTNNLKHNGSTGSRLISGNHKLYDLTEKHIAKFHSAEKALFFNSGYNANTGLIASICQRNDIILFDEFCHASIREGILLSNAKSYKFKHNCITDLTKKLSKLNNKSTIYIITETVFSMDGDSPNLENLIAISNKHNARLILDEAHAVGVFGNNGCGLISEKNSKKIFARIITFGKAIGCHGAAILGSKELIQYLINFSKSFIYTTGLSPHSVATILCAYKELEQTTTLKKLKHNIAFFNSEKEKFMLNDKFVKSNSAIQCLIIKGNNKVKKASELLKSNGYNVKAILSPTVSKNSERLRFCLHSYNTKEEISNIFHLLKIIL